jgi:hypothetical protein
MQTAVGLIYKRITLPHKFYAGVVIEIFKEESY